MAFTNQAAVDVANQTWQSIGDEVFSVPMKGLYPLYTDEATTDSKIVNHAILAAFPRLREWLGSKVYADVVTYSVSGEVKPYEASFKLKRLDLITDRTFGYARRMRQWMEDASLVNDVCSNYLLSNPVGYDGVALFSASHPGGPAGATQSNTTTSALSFATLDAALQNGGLLADENGISLGIQYSVLRVGPKLASLAREIVKSGIRPVAINASGVEATSSVLAATNIENFKGLQIFDGGALTIVVDPQLRGTYDDYWYLHDPRILPIARYVLREIEPVINDQMTSAARFERDELEYSVEGDFALVPAMWQGTYAGIL